MRRLSTLECAALSQFGSYLPSDQAGHLVRDLDAAFVEPVNAGNPYWRFVIPGYARPLPTRGALIPAEGRLADADGVTLVIWLEVDQNGRVLELQLDRFQPGAIIAPDWKTLRLRSLLEPQPCRPLQAGEMRAIERMTRCLEPQLAARIAADVLLSTVRTISSDESWFEFVLPERSRAHGVRRLPVDGRVKDADGAEIRVLLWVDADDRPADLELLRLAGGAVIAPNWESFDAGNQGDE